MAGEQSSGNRQDLVRVLRIIEYVGERAWVEQIVTRSIHGTRVLNGPNRITALTLTEYPEILESAQAPSSEAGR